MWQNNGFDGNRQFPNGFNNQEKFPPSPFGAPPGRPSSGQQYFPNQQSMMQFQDTNGEGFLNGDYKPEVGLYNEGAFMQNQFINANPQFSQSPFNLPSTVSPTPPRPVTQINARAAELKAELLKRREGRGASCTPPVGTQGFSTKPAPRVENSSSLRGSPKIPIPAEKQEQELNVNDLISQYSDSKPATNASARQENLPSAPNVSTSQRTAKQPDLTAKSQVPSLGSSTKVTTPVKNGNQLGHNSNGKAFGGRHHSNGSVSETSEGEILEDAPTRLMQPPKPKETQPDLTKIKGDEHSFRNPRDDQATKPLYSRDSRDDSPPRRPPPTTPKAQAQRIRDERRESFDPRSDQRSQPEYKSERKQYPEPEKRTYLRRNSRDEEYRRTEPIAESPREEFNRPVKEREQKPPTLNDILPIDDDLREWLDITGYHNAPYRNKILNRRRAIAALDAQRDKLLAEMEAEERGGLPVVIRNQTPASSMLPPPIPNKLGGRIEPPLTSAGNSTVDTQPDRVVSNKRPYSDVQDPRDEPIGGKFARVDDRPSSQRAKEEDEVGFRRPRIKEEEEEYRRPHSSGFDGARRPSIDLRDNRYEVRGRSRERESSPGRRTYENRPATRSRPYDDDLPYRNERPYEIHGSYKGKAYDPSYRGRGRGRARDNPYDRHPQDSDSKNEPGFGSRIANGRPYKDPRSFDRGGKGDTRYFIVKSFNEENVLKCIRDSIWTTQVQNGSIFKEAFETCKNVILVFSINKSRAFQGYARMESLPGSMPAPDWQKAINWDTAGAFRVRWLVICATRFHRVGHLKNALNDNQAVLIGKDGQEIEEVCGRELVELIDEECEQALGAEEWKSTDHY